MKKILVVGSSNTDLIIKVPRIPQPGETVLGGDFFSAAGGKGANQAVAASRTGGHTLFISAVGDDDYGKKSVQAYSKEGIDTSHVKICPAIPSGIALINVSDSGENAISVASGANHHLKPADLDRCSAVFKEADLLLIQLEIPFDTVRRAVELAAGHGKTSILNPAPAGKLPAAVLRGIDILTPNETEASLLSGIRVTDTESAREACQALHQQGVAMVILTLGSRGALVSDPAKGMQELVPGFEVNAVDTTAAGDVFNGALAVALGEEKELPAAIRFAHAAAALSVCKLGAQPSIPSRAEVDRFLDGQASD